MKRATPALALAMRAILLSFLFASTAFAAFATAPTASACVTLPTCCRGVQVGSICVQGPTCPPLDPSCPRAAPLLPDAACTETVYLGPAAGVSCHVGTTVVGHDVSCHFSCPNTLRHSATEGTGGVTVQ